MSLYHSASSEDLSGPTEPYYTVKYGPSYPGFGIRRATSVPDFTSRYHPNYYPTSNKIQDVWTNYWWERRHFGGERYWPHYGFPYRRYWHDKSIPDRVSSLCHYPSLSWTSRFSPYDKLDPVSWRRYRAPCYPFDRHGPYLDKRFEIRMSVFDSRLHKYTSTGSYAMKPYQPRIWHPTPSCWSYSYHWRR